MASLAVWNTISPVRLSVYPAINLNALKNLQFPMLKNMQHAALRRFPLDFPLTKMYILRGALVLFIKSTSSNPKTAYLHALISATNRLAKRLPCCIPSHPIPITSRRSLSFPDPAVKRTDVRKSKQESGPLPIPQYSDTNTGTNTDAHTTTTKPFTSSFFLQPPWSIHTEYALHFPFHMSNESIVECTVPLHLRTVLSVLQATLPVFPFFFLFLHAPSLLPSLHFPYDYS